MSRRRNGRSRRWPSRVAAGFDLSGDGFHYDTLAANVTKDGSDLLGQVNDLSGNARHQIQATAGTKPLWVAAELNGKDVARFNCASATAKSMRATGLGADTALGRTVAVVYKVDSLPALNNAANLWFRTSSGGSGGFSVEVFSSTGTRRLRFIQSTTFTNSSVTFGTVTLATYEVLVVAFSASADDAAATVIAEVNGAGTAVTGSANFSTVDATAIAQLGTSGATGSPNFSIAELYDWPRVLDAASRLQIARNLGTEYGITVA